MCACPGTPGLPLTRLLLLCHVGCLRYAVKLLSKARFTSEKEKKAVRLEVDILKRLSGHEHMVTLHDHVEDKANVYLVMEWCKGGDLMKYVYKCKHFSEKVASCLFQQMLLAVQHCHENGVVHRDLKPDNFLFASTEGRTHLKIADFGLSTIIDSPDQIITDVRCVGMRRRGSTWSRRGCVLRVHRVCACLVSSAARRFCIFHRA